MGKKNSQGTPKSTPDHQDRADSTIEPHDIVINSPIIQSLAYELLKGPISTPDIRRKCGCSNAADQVMKLRHMDVDILETDVPCVNRYGQETYYGLYHATPAGIRVLAKWAKKQAKGSA